MKRLALGGTAVLVALLACSDTNDPDDGRCEEAVTITATPGTTPTISWTPACTVAQLRVAEVADDDEMWGIFTSENTITGGVVYGETPTGATATRAPLQLTTGVEYRVILSIHDPESGQLLVAATASFTP